MQYCGSVHVGMEGDVKQIEKAIWHLLKSGEAKPVSVRFECLEIGIKVTRETDDQVSERIYSKDDKLYIWDYRV